MEQTVKLHNNNVNECKKENELDTSDSDGRQIFMRQETSTTDYKRNW